MKKKTNSGKKWFKLIAEVREESDTLAKIIKQGADQREACNKEFAKSAQRSFNAIHNVKRTPVTPTTIPRMKTRKSSLKTREICPSSFGVMEFETPPTNVDKWPKRENSAKRIFTPEKLEDYPVNQRHKDLFVLSGESIFSNQ